MLILKIAFPKVLRILFENEELLCHKAFILIQFFTVVYFFLLELMRRGLFVDNNDQRRTLRKKTP